MRCAHASWVPTPYPPKAKVSTQSTFSIAQTQTHVEEKPGDVTLDVKLPLPSHVKSITSTSNPFVKHCLKLRSSSSYRHSHGSALVVGASPIRSHSNPSIYDLSLSGFYFVVNQAASNSTGHLVFLLFCFGS